MNSSNTKEDLGYVVWGTQQVLSYFFNSGNMDINSNDVRDTLKDIRTIVCFADPGVDFYSMEFTSQYKVYTQYRSLYDWEDQEGYMAITIYIPHFLKPDDGTVLQLLNKSINYYWNNCVDRAYRIKNDIEEDKAWFDNLFRINAEKDRGLNHISSRNETFGLIRYEDKNELTLYFDNPYHRNYYRFRKVLFIKQSEQQFPGMQVLNINPVLPRYSAKFTSFETNVSSEFYVNGEIAEDLNNLLGDDEVKAIFKKPYHQSISWQGTLEQLLQQNPTRLHGDTISIILPIFVPSKREIQFVVRDAKTNLPISGFSISANGQTADNTKIVLRGEEIGKDLKCVFSADNYDDFEEIIPGIKPEDKNFRTPWLIDVNMQPLEKVAVSIICVDANTNKGLEGMTVNCGKDRQTTNSDGETRFYVTRKDLRDNLLYTLHVTGQGYEPYEESIQVNKLINTFYVKLVETKVSSRLSENIINERYLEGNTITGRPSETIKNDNADNREDKNHKPLQIKNNNNDKPNEIEENPERKNNRSSHKLLLSSIIVLSVVLIFLVVLLAKALLDTAGDDRMAVTTIDLENEKSPSAATIPEKDTAAPTLPRKGNIKPNTEDFIGLQELNKNDPTKENNNPDPKAKVNSKEIDNIKDILKKLNDFNFSKNDLEKWTVDIKNNKTLIMFNKDAILSNTYFSSWEPVTSIINNINELKKLCDKLSGKYDPSLKNYFKECANNDHFTFWQKQKFFKWYSIDNESLKKIFEKKDRGKMTISEIMKLE